LATFGLAVIIQNALLEQFSADSRRLNVGAIATDSIHVTSDISIGWFPLITLLVAVGLLGGLQLLLRLTPLGRALRATSDDQRAAQLVGIDNRRIYAIATAISLATVAVATVPYWASEGRTRNLVQFFTLLALAQMWNLLAGYAGLVSIGQQAFIGIGAYSLYVLGDDAGAHPYLAVLLAGLVAAGLAVPTAALAFRLRGGYFAIGTWVIAEVYHLLTVNRPSLGGGNGVTILSAAGLDRTERGHATYWWALGVGAGSVLLCYALLRSRL